MTAVDEKIRHLDFTVSPDVLRCAGKGCEAKATWLWKCTTDGCLAVLSCHAHVTEAVQTYIGHPWVQCRGCEKQGALGTLRIAEPL